MKRLFICQIVPNNLVHIIKAPQASNTFSYNLIENHLFDQVFSIVPLSYYHNEIKDERIIKFYKGKYTHKKYKNIFCYIKNSLKVAGDSRKYNYIWFYNICNANLLAYIIIKYIFRKKTYVIILDHTPANKTLSLQNLKEWLIKKSSGAIALSSRGIFKIKNIDYLAGIIPLNKIKTIIHPINPHKISFLFSGKLNLPAGFDMVLKVFKTFPNLELYITGPDSFEKELIKNHPNIHYLGYLPYSDYLKLYDKVDICLNLRNPEYPENINNFPSKILEFFSFNKIVISTIEYPELKDFKYFTVNYDENQIRDLINKIPKIKVDTLLEYCNNREQMKNNFSEHAWSKALSNIESK